jgi:hypothetical protein
MPKYQWVLVRSCGTPLKGRLNNVVQQGTLIGFKAKRYFRSRKASINVKRMREIKK